MIGGVVARDDVRFSHLAPEPAARFPADYCAALSTRSLDQMIDAEWQRRIIDEGDSGSES